MSVPVRRLAQLNPTVPGFDHLSDDDEITFVPLEAVWPDGHADFSRRGRAGTYRQGYTRFRSGDVLLPKVSPTFEAGRVAVAKIATQVGAATTEVHVLRAVGDTDARFLAYVLRSDRFLREGAATQQGVGNLRRVSQDFILGFPIEVVAHREQRAIADYLDDQTAKIDALIAKQEQMIELLEERRAAVVEALLLPFETAPLKYHLVRNDGGVWGNDPTGDGDTVVLRSTEQTQSGGWRIEEPALRALSPEESRATRLSAGDIVVTKSSGSMTHVGKASLVSEEIGRRGVSYSNFNQRLRMSATLVPRFVWWALNCRLVREQIPNLSTTTTGLTNLTGTVIGRLMVPVGPVEDQRRTVNLLDSQTAKIDALIAKTREHIALAKERRSALITAAVTGQIDVRTATREVA